MGPSLGPILGPKAKSARFLDSTVNMKNPLLRKGFLRTVFDEQATKR